MQDGGFPDSVDANPRSIPDDVTIPDDATAKHTTEENPLYLFDRWFHQNVDTLQQDWDVPRYFEDDLFSLLGEDQRLVRRCIERPLTECPQYPRDILSKPSSSLQAPIIVWLI